MNGKEHRGMGQESACKARNWYASEVLFLYDGINSSISTFDCNHIEAI